MTFQYVTPARKRKRNKENEGPIEFQFQNYTPASTSFKKPRVPLQEITPQAKEAAKAEYIRLQEEMKNAGEKRLQDQVEEGMERLKEAGFNLFYSFIKGVFSSKDRARSSG
ncbi:hypothetical protein CC1G_11479 [Coprinopsis cinerea okayama7|uniref:Uncharacterized protein n=1 Tax=Coprinopsis cinerea (strain Okayama-7 / 130 / ATCC MYA-4618 / FGSC 9003) TaxID=240176 RepID=A8NMQ5_COPC7|nr:hypothetical protein CC1G_11479 [Coprinopsis cinerea okayama7\|eukprot:XP_001834965.1 hypothetical protein CC1G_11479 [Coprinopsis cinerea okayama7\